MVAIWIYGAIIVVKKTENTTYYEKAVLIAGLAIFILYLIGSAS